MGSRNERPNKTEVHSSQPHLNINTDYEDQGESLKPSPNGDNSNISSLLEGIEQRQRQSKQNTLMSPYSQPDPARFGSRGSQGNRDNQPVQELKRVTENSRENSLKDASPIRDDRQQNFEDVPLRGDSEEARARTSDIIQKLKETYPAS